MAEVAAGAVTSLLGVIRTEAQLLRLVGGDVQFIKEEMESMNSFLAHLARSAPPGGEHDEQVRTWMNQVRLLAQDCNNCIDLYLYRGNLHIHRAKGRLQRHLWWVYWFMHKVVAQHHAAVQLRELKDRAHDVGERRLRYGVEVPSKSEAAAAGQLPPAARLMSSSAAEAASGFYYVAGDDEEDDDDDQLAVGAATDRSALSALFSLTLDDYVKAKIREWINNLTTEVGYTTGEAFCCSFVIVAPDRYRDVITLARETAILRPDIEEYQIGYDLAILIDIPALHMEFLPLGPKEVLFYILRQLKQGTDQQGEEDTGVDFGQLYFQKRRIYGEKKTVLCQIKNSIEKMKIYEKLDKIKSDLQNQPPSKGQKEDMDQKDPELHTLLQNQPPSRGQQEEMDQKDPELHALLKQLLWSSLPAPQQDLLMKNKDMSNKLSASDKTIKLLAEKLKDHMEAIEQGEGVEGGVQNRAVEEDREGGKQKVEVSGGGEIEDEEEEEEEEEWKICLHLDQYVHILRQVFPKSSSNNNKSSVMQATNTLFGEDQIKQIIDLSKQEIIRELQGGKDDKIQDQTGQKTEAIFKEIVDQKMDKIKHEFKEQLKIKGLLDGIERQLQGDCPLFILKIDETVDLPRWEDTRNALSLLKWSGDVLIVTTAKDIQQAKDYCYPQSEPIDYSLAGFYHATLLEITKQQKNEENYDAQIFRNILEQCEPNEFCMKIFTHALYVNPKRSNKELNKLHKNLLQASPKSSNIIAKNMFKFSYTDMPKEYKSCLLYLAIFPPGYKIRRSTLIGRWVAEGVIFKEDWHSSVHWANRCFDEFINRCLVDPVETGAAGKVKNCVVGDLVHGFITKIAKKQHIVETRLSRHLARHFSIFNDLQLLSSDRIDGFFKGLSKLSRVSLLKVKVLDLEGCQCFGGKNQRYLEDICSKMLLLKYLSLRGTDVTQLPSKINNLRELEVLDIRQTTVPMNATANVLLLKLKRLLAGNTDRSPTPILRAEEVSTAVQIPNKIEKMVNMEVLSNVKAESSRDLKDIGKLWHLRKLGVVVDDNFHCLKNLLRAISNLHECLCSLSITLLHECKATPSQEFPQSLKHPPKLLKSLSISGTTQKGHLLTLFIKDVDNNLLNNLTLSCTSLNQNNLDVLAKLPKLQSIRLRHIAFTDIESLMFKKEEFKYLKYLLVEGSSFTHISFMDGAACMLEKMALSFTNIESISGVDGLEKLEEVELSMSSGNKKKNDTLLSSFNNGKQTMAKLTIFSTSLEQGDQGTQNMITFNEGEFPKLKVLTVDCSATTKIIFTRESAPKLEKIVCSSFTSATSEVVFTSGSAPKLEKIVWSSSTSLSGIDNLPKLMELEFNGDLVPEVVKEAIIKRKNKPNLKHNKPKTQDQAKGDEQEDDEDAASARCSLFCGKKHV